MPVLLCSKYDLAPWNFSFDVIDGFLQSKDYMESDLAGLKKAPTISAFTDFCPALWVKLIEG